MVRTPRQPPISPAPITAAPMPLYDAVLPMPSRERHDIHHRLDALFRRRAAAPRPYLWAFHGTHSIVVRTATPDATHDWMPLVSPRFGQQVRLTLTVEPRIRRRTETIRHKHNRAPADDAEAQDWVTAQLREAGLVPLMVQVQRAVSLIERPPRPFRITTLVCHGRVAVYDDEAVAAALAHGIGNGKVYGFGLLQLD